MATSPRQRTDVAFGAAEDAVRASIEAAAMRAFAWQAVDPAHLYHGAWIDPATGIDDPGHNGTAALLTVTAAWPVQTG